MGQLVKRTLMIRGTPTNSEVHQYLFTDTHWRQCSKSSKFGIFLNICSNANVFFGPDTKSVWKMRGESANILPFVSTQFKMAIYTCSIFAAMVNFKIGEPSHRAIHRNQARL